jgi:predicted alpha/beta-fold hydrolase
MESTHGVDIQAGLTAKTIDEFDEAITIKMFGFRTVS